MIASVSRFHHRVLLALEEHLGALRDDVLMKIKIYRLTQNNGFNLHPTGDP